MCHLVQGATSVFEKVEVTSGRAAPLMEKVVSAGRLDREFGGRGKGVLLKKACREAGQERPVPCSPQPSEKSVPTWKVTALRRNYAGGPDTLVCAGDAHSAVRAKETGTPVQAGIGQLHSLTDGLWSRAWPVERHKSLDKRPGSLTT